VVRWHGFATGCTRAQSPGGRSGAERGVDGGHTGDVAADRSGQLPGRLGELVVQLLERVDQVTPLRHPRQGDNCCSVRLQQCQPRPQRAARFPSVDGGDRDDRVPAQCGDPPGAQHRRHGGAADHDVGGAAGEHAQVKAPECSRDRAGADPAGDADHSPASPRPPQEACLRGSTNDAGVVASRSEAVIEQSLRSRRRRGRSPPFRGLRALDSRLRARRDRPFVLLEYAAGLPPEWFAEVAEQVADLARMPGPG
jgi:hypothetical protein